MDKSALRKQALTKRKSLPVDELAQLNQMLLAQFKTLDFSKVNSVHIFLPIVAKNEPDTFLMIDWLQTTHPKIEIVVPKADFNTSSLTHYTYTSKQLLVNNRYQIPEPKQAKHFNGIPDLVIVPLLAFDERGYRVGYGKGFYDRFLQHISSQKIGLSFFTASAQIIDVHLNDVKLDMCITPHKIVKF